MRVITGIYKNRKLETPENRNIRPTSDKVKESIFNIIMNETYGRVFCDLFCGTGGLGIEALSRGASKCYFCDSAGESIRLTKKNVTHVGANEKAVIMQADYRRALTRIHDQVDVFLLDPPYQAGLYENCLTMIDELELLAPEGVILAEHDKRDPLPERIGGLALVKERRYGKTMVSIYRHADEVEGSLEEPLEDAVVETAEEGSDE